MPGRFDSQDYIGVWERLDMAAGQVKHINTSPPQLLTDTFGALQVTVTLQDERSATGTAFFQLGSAAKNAQATNPLEDAETSALGRALRMLGYATSRASLEEMQRIPPEAPAPRTLPADPERESLLGRLKTARAGIKQMGLVLSDLKPSMIADWSFDRLLSETEIAEREYDTLRTPAEKAA